MDTYEKLVLLAELYETCCQLDHGPCESHESHAAVDYLVCPIGYRNGEGVEIQVRELTIPICEECAAGLRDSDWALLFCLNCLASQWVLRPVARLKYRHHLIWLGSCPKCSQKPAGIYFN